MPRVNASHLKGDVVRFRLTGQAQVAFYLEAQNGVPRGIDLESLFAGNHVGPTGYFDYVGSDRSNGATMDDKPVTGFLRTNAISLSHRSLPAETLRDSGT